MRKLFFVLLLILLTVGSCAAQSCGELPVSVEHYALFSEALNDDIQFDVYIPACVDERVIDGYPVLYLLHGQDMGIEVWQEIKLAESMARAIEKYDLPLFLTVVPQEDNYLLSMSISEFGNALLGTVIPFIESHYNIDTSREGRAIGGISRGALWAEKLAFENPEAFGTLGMHSAPGTPFDNQTLYYLTQNLTPEQYPRIRIDIGSEDQYCMDANKAAEQLTYAGLTYEFVVRSGSHDKLYWQSQLPEYFNWYFGDYLTTIPIDAE